MNKNSKKTIKQLLSLSACCIIPILLMLLIPMITSFTPLGAKIIYFIAPFICPILMGSMFFFMFKSNSKSDCCNNKSFDSVK